MKKVNTLTIACECADAIDAEMHDWTAIGGGNSGCCGDQRHTYGFHLAGGNVSPNDYSRRHEAATPYNMSWACAGDFAHNNVPALRAMHATVLTRLMRGELPMICEFIGQPYANQPVLYWNRWTNELVRYTGAGHDRWSHISWWRSKANQRAYLWRPSEGMVLVSNPVTVPANWINEDGELGPATIRKWQERMGTKPDGVISHPRSELVTSVQRYLNGKINARLVVDGDGIRQDGREYQTVAALQRYLRTPVDGRLSAPKSMAVQALQHRLNLGTF